MNILSLLISTVYNKKVINRTVLVRLGYILNWKCTKEGYIGLKICDGRDSIEADTAQ